jgi:hypothetical protein
MSGIASTIPQTLVPVGDALPTARPPASDAVRMDVPGLRVIARHAWPHLVEGTMVPFVLLAVGLQLTSVRTAVLVTLTWSVVALTRRLLARSRVSGALLLGVVLMSARAVFVLLTGNVLVYFLQPVVSSTLVAGAFFGSVLVGRPLVWRLAGDFLPLPAHLIGDPGIARLFRRLSILWGGATLTGAALHAWLLLSVPVTVFVVLKLAVQLGVTGSAIGVSVWWSRPHVTWPGQRRRAEAVPGPALDAGTAGAR